MELYDKFHVAGSGISLVQMGNANLNPWTEAKVDTKNPDRGPLLIIDGGADHTVPWAIADAAYKLQVRNPGVTEIVKIRTEATPLRSTTAGARSPRPHSRSSRGSRRRRRGTRGWKEPDRPALVFSRAAVGPLGAPPQNEEVTVSMPAADQPVSFARAHQAPVSTDGPRSDGLRLRSLGRRRRSIERRQRSTAVSGRARCRATAAGRPTRSSSSGGGSSRASSPDPWPFIDKLGSDVGYRPDRRHRRAERDVEVDRSYPAADDVARSLTERERRALART